MDAVAVERNGCENYETNEHRDHNVEADSHHHLPGASESKDRPDGEKE